MNEIKLLSTWTRTKDIDWHDTVFVDKIMFDKTLFEQHRNRIAKVFANAPDNVKEQQLQNILMRDTLFNKAMDKIVRCYEFKLDSEDIEKFTKLIANNIPKDSQVSQADYDARIRQIAEKLVQKELVFNDIAQTYNITVDAKEAMDVLNEYNKNTGNPIEDITSDKTKLTGAVNALLEEKISAFIINKFDKNFDELHKNIKLDMEARQKADLEKQPASTSEQTMHDQHSTVEVVTQGATPPPPIPTVPVKPIVPEAKPKADKKKKSA